MAANKLAQRKDGRYKSKVYLGIGDDGRPKYKYVYGKSSKEVADKISNLKSQMKKGIDISATYTFGDVVKNFKRMKESTMSEGDFKTMCSRLDPFLEELADIDIKLIRADDLQPIINELFKVNPTTGNPTAKRTLARYISTCSAVFEYAIESRLFDYNPCKYVSVPKNAAVKERRALTDQERKWIEETPGRGQVIGMLGCYAGLRKGEMAALTWDDIDLEENTITVNKSFDFKTSTVKSPKTAAGIRVVSIPQKLADYLADLPRTCPYVVHNADNRRVTFNGFQKCWESYIRELDLKYGAGKKPKKYAPEKHIITIDTFTIHELRHTFCTLMYLAGVDILTAQQQMGHADVKTTLSIYSHLDAKYKKKNISKLDDFLA